MRIEEISKPRFEFRTFGQNFDDQAYRMSRLSIPVPENIWMRTSDEIYIVSRTNDINNIKIRDEKMDIKTYVQNVDGLEQWNPLMKVEFPMKADMLKEKVFPASMVDMPELSEDEYPLEEFLRIVNEINDLQAVKVHKVRYGYMLNNTICEVGEVLINGAMLLTISSESTEIEDIKKTIKEVGLEGMENINYLQAIKRVIGMIDKDFVN